MRILRGKAARAAMGAGAVATLIAGLGAFAAPAANAAAPAKVKDGTYVGATSKANEYTPTTVSIVVKGGKVQKVSVKISPKDQDSVVINKMAVPQLIKQAVTVQSAKKVSNISGASLTTTAFKQSLQSALLKAGIKK